MFTGIVESTGTVTDRVDSDGGIRLRLRARVDGLRVGDSVALNGACLTAAAVEEGGFWVEAVPETLRRTTIGEAAAGVAVNLERAMPASGRFDGHLVQGHVDGVGTVREVAPEGDGKRMRVTVPEGLRRYLVEKGSVAVDGVSLTVAEIHQEGFSVALIPHTLRVTVLGTRRPGDRVNLEIDILAKYVERLLEAGR
ncbi:MAG: riboflavin synthase [Acidimicrobiia bacterium]